MRGLNALKHINEQKDVPGHQKQEQYESVIGRSTQPIHKLFSIDIDDAAERLNRVPEERLRTMYRGKVEEEWAKIEGLFQTLRERLNTTNQKITELKTAYDKYSIAVQGELPSVNKISWWMIIAMLMVIGEYEFLSTTLSYNLNMSPVSGALFALTITGAVFASKIFIQKGFFERSEFNPHLKRSNSILMSSLGILTITGISLMYFYIGFFRAEVFGWGLDDNFQTLMEVKPWIGYGLMGSIGVGVLIGTSVVWAKLGTMMKKRRLYRQYKEYGRELADTQMIKSDLGQEISTMSTLMQNKKQWMESRLEELVLLSLSEIAREIESDIHSNEEQAREFESAKQLKEQHEEESSEDLKNKQHELYAGMGFEELMNRVKRNDVIDRASPKLNGVSN